MNIETATQEITNKGRIINPSQMEGRWKLTYTPENSIGAEAFGGFMLEPYENPITRRLVYPFDGMNKPMPGYFIDTLVSYFNPDKDENNEHYNSVAFLLGHPEVMIEGIVIGEKFAKYKKTNSKLRLVNLDYVDQLKMDSQEIVDSMIGKLSMESGKFAISLEKLQYILAKLNLPFVDKRYITDPQQLKRQLRKKVKDYVRLGSSQANEVENILENIEDAKKTFLIKYLLDIGIIVFSSGTFKHDSQPLGFNIESSVDYLKLNPEHYATLQNVLEKHLKGIE